jgi:type-F conjugative transfer system pilin assembly protein TrbC
VSALIKLLLPVMALFAAADLAASQTEAPVISKQLKQRAQTTINQIKLSPEMQKRAEALRQLTSTTNDQKKIKDYENRVAIAAGIGSLSGSKNADEDKKDKASKSGKYILFISASIPMPTLRRYAKDIAKNDGLMVLRGTVGADDKLGPTLAFMAEVLKKDPYCEGVNCEFVKANVTIDPRLFTINEIKQVPALVFVERFNFGGYVGKGQGGELPGKAGVVVYGDASFGGMVGGLVGQ